MHGNDLQATGAQLLVHLLEVGRDIVAYVAATSVEPARAVRARGRVLVACDAVQVKATQNACHRAS